MTQIELKETEKAEAIEKLKQYCDQELQLELGTFDAQFLLEFFAEQLGWSIYNQGLADAFGLMENSLEGIYEKIYELQQEPPR
mgnify:FL=1|jgi:uncharacterized protein (DUF2164 family)